MKWYELMMLGVLFLLLAALAAEESMAQQGIGVSAALSLKAPFEEIGRLCEKEKGLKVFFNFGASGDLLKQIEAGAPVDVFASAAQKDMDEAEKKGLIVPESRMVFARNTLALVVPAASPYSVKSFRDLRSSGIRRIAIGNPKTAPAGRYAEEVFLYYGMLDAVRGKLIYADNVRQVLDYLARGEVDAGVVYATDAQIRAKEVATAAIAPEESHRPVIYPVAVIAGTKNEPAARAFISILLSPEGLKILEKYGFRRP